MIDTAIGLLIGFCIGVVVITLLTTSHARALHEENDRLRRALHYFRGLAIQHPELKKLTRYIDNVLSDEAGA